MSTKALTTTPKPSPDDGTGLFHRQPLEIGGFILRGRDAVPSPFRDAPPTLDGWMAALEFASALQEASPFWVGDLLVYAESRAEWAERLSQAMTVTGLSRQTLENLATISRRLSARARDVSPSISHAAVVTKLAPEQQERWLAQAKNEEWTVSDLTKAVRAAARPPIIEGQAALEGMYRVLYADPPWPYRDAKVPPSGALGKAARHYPDMTIEALCELPVAAHALPDAVLFLWVPAPMLLTNPGPREVIEAWDFVFKTGAVWDKVLGNWGHYFRVRHEHLLVCTRGSCLPDEPTPMPDSIFVERRGDEHSAKPAIAREIIQKLYTKGPYLELFARTRTDNWDCFGNDARLWADESREARQ